MASEKKTFTAPMQVRVEKIDELGSYSAYFFDAEGQSDERVYISQLNAAMADDLPEVMAAWREFLNVVIKEVYANQGMEVASVTVVKEHESN